AGGEGGGGGRVGGGRGEGGGVGRVGGGGGAMGVEETEDRLEERRLSRAIGPDDAGDRAALDAEPDPVEDVDPFHVPRNDSVQLEERHLSTEVGLENEGVICNLLERTLGDE